MIKNILLLLLILAILITISGIIPGFESKSLEDGYQTIIGTVHLEGTATINDLVLTVDDKQYLISKVDSELDNLRGLPLVLTGKLSNLAVGPYDGEFEVYKYNTYYDRSKEELEEVSILGDLVKGENNLVLLTPNQMVIQLNPDTYHSLENHSGKKVVIKGELIRKNSYQGKMDVQSYQILN